MSVLPVSVIIPAYNVASSIVRAIDSVVSQQPAPKEIIVIDDGSTDNTLEMLRKYGSKINLIRQENAGAGAARNRGLQIATGDYITFLDADDYWRPSFLEKTIYALRQNNECGAVLTAWHKILTNGEEVLVPEYARFRPNGECSEITDFFEFFAHYGHIQTGAIVLCREVVQRIGLMNPVLRSSQDLEYWLLAACHAKWCFLNSPVYVNDSRRVGRRIGWKSKHALRRKFCPTVEQWQERLLPNVPVEKMPAFEKIRGTVAFGYAYAKLLGQDIAGAVHIVKAYGGCFPMNHTAWLMKALARFGAPGSFLLSEILRLREGLK